MTKEEFFEVTDGGFSYAWSVCGQEVYPSEFKRFSDEHVVSIFLHEAPEGGDSAEIFFEQRVQAIVQVILSRAALDQDRTIVIDAKTDIFNLLDECKPFFWNTLRSIDDCYQAATQSTNPATVVALESDSGSDPEQRLAS